MGLSFYLEWFGEPLGGSQRLPHVDGVAPRLAAQRLNDVAGGAQLDLAAHGIDG